MKPNIDLTIDQLVLEGFSQRDAFYIGQSVQSRLQQLMEVNHLGISFTNGIHHQELLTKPMNINITSRPEKVGNQIAQSIYNGLSTSNNTKN